MALFFCQRGQIYIDQVDIDASWGLLQRMYPQNRSLSTIIFGTDLLPMPSHLHDFDHPETRKLTSIINQKLLLVTSLTAVGQWRLKPDQVDRLDVQDPRVVGLRKKLYMEILLIPEIQRLSEKRIQLLVPIN